MTLDVKLVPIDDALVRALEAGDEALRSLCGLVFGDEAVRLHALDLARQSLDLVRRAPRPAPWLCYLAGDPATGTAVGTCAFKTGPVGGAVEIAYSTFPAHERRGWATAMAGALIALAHGQPGVERVIAHTLPERGASSRVLEKSGLHWGGEVTDPEDGRVWLWERRVDGSGAEDAASIDGLIAALYDTISGPAGAPRDWRRLSSLFRPGARLMRTLADEAGGVTLVTLSIQQFATLAEPAFRTSGFHERELARRVDRFGHVAHAWSSYAASATPDGGEPLGRGVNSIQLWWDGRRWWITAMVWDDERGDVKLPGDMDPAAAGASR